MFTPGRLAQLARASRLHREGRGFKSLNAHHVMSRDIVKARTLRFGPFLVFGLVCVHDYSIMVAEGCTFRAAGLLLAFGCGMLATWVVFAYATGA